jgi:hypothetical protein
MLKASMAMKMDFAKTLATLSPALVSAPVLAAVDVCIITDI